MTDTPRVAHITTVDLTLRFLLLPQLTRLRDEGFDVTAISAPGPWTKEIEAEGIRHIPWRNATRAWNPTADLAALRELVSILRRERFELVHTHNPKPGVLGRIAARIAGVDCVVNTVHGLYATPEDSVLKRWSVLGMERLAGRFSDLELYQSEEDLQWARSIWLVPAARMRYLGNGVDVSSFNPSAVSAERVTQLRAELGFSPDQLVIGMVGRLVAEKGYQEFFTAARRVRQRIPSARFLAVGDVDPDKADSISSDAIQKARGDVVFAGWRSDVRDLLAAMDVFVLPSWREGVPRSAIEAAAMGKPLVLTDIRGCREIAREGIEGLLVLPRDPERLADAITRVLEDPELRRSLGERARARAVERFDERRVTDRVIAYYREIMRQTPPEVESSTVGIRLARPADAAALARLHTQALPNAFLPLLGERFLRRLYRALALDDEAVTLVAEMGGRPVGFAAGVVSAKGFFRRFLLRHGIAAGLAAAPRLLKPDLFRRALETARYPGTGPEVTETELLSIGVDPQARGQGVGKALVAGIVRGLSAKGASQVKAVVGAENQTANLFYSSLEFKPLSEITVHAGEKSQLWVRTCRS